MNGLDQPAPHLSVVIPAYNEAGNLTPLIEEIERALARRMRFEVVLVDDGSDDGTAQEAMSLLARWSWLTVATHAFRRGQSAAIRTGVVTAAAPFVAVLDGDGQNDPADIPRLYAALRLSAATMAVGERTIRRDNLVRRWSSRLANHVRSFLLGDGIRDTGCGLKVFHRAAFLELPAFDHMHRFLPALVQSRGGTVRVLPVNHRPRRCGESKYGIGNRLWAGLYDLVGVMWLARRQFQSAESTIPCRDRGHGARGSADQLPTRTPVR